MPLQLVVGANALDMTASSLTIISYTKYIIPPNITYGTFYNNEDGPTTGIAVLPRVDDNVITPYEPNSDVESGNANAALEGEAAPNVSRPPPPRGRTCLQVIVNNSCELAVGNIVVV
ncbi:hypothetical protein RR46_08917 [Papilio xuthus]|uniref:Uncharacterized protein n=1 Tax=Papilio xuthus TaxID=66420 RepID=A0A194PR73_PAPXU|nr:hypothetical protein RR46_08917 [Papilio xuthus]